LSSAKVNIHELIAWELDEYPYRDHAVGISQESFTKQVQRAQQKLAERDCYAGCNALLAEETENIRDLLTAHAQRDDMREEYAGMDWKLGVVDLRHLLAFQRRLVFNPMQHCSRVPLQTDWSQLISLSLSSPRDTEHCVVSEGSVASGFNIRLSSSNPDLQLRLVSNAGKNSRLPFSLYGGSPFFEVAELHGRWFLRDGYHRAYRLLEAEVFKVPAVVIHARTIAELGATEPWFFSEDQLFSDRPPQVVDFLDEQMVLRYERDALRKVIRIRIEESLEFLDETKEVHGGTL
jgi:hypothetical protein